MHKFQVAFSTFLTFLILCALSFIGGTGLSLESFGYLSIGSVLYHSCLEIYLAVRK